MITLGIETSCDETSVGIVKDGFQVLSNVTSSQIKDHNIYGGVIPELASRLHVVKITPLLTEAMKIANLDWADIDLVAATQGPGLLGALSIGYTSAKALAYSLSRPLASINHIEGHIYANLCDRDQYFYFPILALVASGGHTQLILIKSEFEYQLIGNTLDDAIGEAFDKSARLIGLGYPGGPVIDKLAKEGDPKAYKFPKVKTERPLDFSFSGLKTAVLRSVQEFRLDNLDRDDQRIKNFCASLQARLVKELMDKTMKAAEELKVRNILIAGGVTANSFLRAEMEGLQGKYNISIPAMRYCVDNGAMIASAGYFRFQNGETSEFNMAPIANMSLAK